VPFLPAVAGSTTGLLPPTPDPHARLPYDRRGGSLFRSRAPAPALTFSAALGTPMTEKPTTATVLPLLTKGRLVELSRDTEVALSLRDTKDALVKALLGTGRLGFRALVEHLGRDELRAACEAHGLPATSRSRSELGGALLQAHGAGDSIPPRPLFAGRAT